MKVTPKTYDDFGDGIDRRAGRILNSAKKFWELDNYVVTSGRKIEMRPPLLQDPDGLDAVNSQGARTLDGRIVTVGKLGVPATHANADATTLYFDNPEGATTWELLELVVYQTKVCALIQHTFPSVAAPLRNYLHVFDALRPTYVEDPSCPPSWTPAFPTQPYGEGTPATYRSYRPRLSIVAERLAITTAAGDVAMCAVSLPRVWNTLSPAEILANGEMFYRVLGASAAAQSFTLPVTHADLLLEARYAAYVCEYLKADGSWSQFTEVTSAANAGEYSLAAAANRFDTTKLDETRITVMPPAGFFDGQVIRFRAIADPPATVVSGLNLTAVTIAGELNVEGGNLVGGVMVHEGKSLNIQTVAIPKLETPGQTVRVVVRVPGAQVSIPIIVAADTTACPLNGQQRYWSRIVADITANDGTQEREGVAGVVLSTSGAHIVVGSVAANTGKVIFYNGPNTAGISVGDVLTVGPVRCRVLEILPLTSYLFERYYAGCMRVEIISGAEYVGYAGSPPAYYEWAEVGFNGGYTYALTGGRVAITVGGTRIDGAGVKFTTDLKVGKNVEVNGEVRKVISITSDIVAEVELPFTTSGSFIALRDPRYEYAYDVGDTGNEWYATKEAEITLRGSGKDDAVLVGTSSYEENGDVPLAVAAMQNRMVVQFPTQMQLWAVGTSLASFKLISTMGQSAGAATRPDPVLVDGMTGLPTVNGPRLFSPEGDDKSYIQFVAVGDMLKGFAFPDITRAVWWPRLRAWVMFVGSGRFYVLSVHRDVKVLAWSTWTVPAALTTVDAMFIRGDLLLITSGGALYYFDADEVDHTDFDGNPVTTLARFVYNDMGAPNKNKKLITLDLVQTGKSAMSVHVNPRTLNGDEVSGPVSQGVTVGAQGFPIMAMGPGIGLRLTSSDPTGHSLDQITVNFTLLNR